MQRLKEGEGCGPRALGAMADVAAHSMGGGRREEGSRGGDLTVRAHCIVHPAQSGHSILQVFHLICSVVLGHCMLSLDFALLQLGVSS